MPAINNENKKDVQNNDNKEENNRAVADKAVKDAYTQAEKDIEKDADLSIHSPNDDLDEGETARLGDDKNELL